jgi:hypothetical protein
MTSKKKPKSEGRKKTPRKKAPPRGSKKPSRAIARRGPVQESSRPASSIDPLCGDLPGVTLKDEAEVLRHFSRIDPRLAEAWKRDVAMHEGAITLRRVMYPASFGGATHYAYVDRRLLWYLRHDPTDPLGARWDGYLASPSDAPPGTTVVVVRTDFVAKKIPPQIGEGSNAS